MNLSCMPRAERPREKLLSQGPSSLSDAELLAIFLRTGTRGKNAVELACELLQRSGGLRKLLECGLEDLRIAKGFGTAKYVQIRAGLELGRRYLYSTMAKGSVLDSPCVTRDYLRMHLKKYEHEVFACLFLDNRNRVISFDEMFSGTIDSASVHPREIVKRALKHNAAAVILAHNHPSGVAEPSPSDQMLTQRICEALQLIDVRVLDHFVIGDDVTTSLAERGLM